MIMEKYISEKALKAQQEYAPALKKCIRKAAKLADDTIKTMLSLKHITRGDDRARSVPAHKYWLAYFWYETLAGDKIGVGFGYDLKQWKNEASTCPILPPWRIYIYLWHPPIAIHDFTAIQNICKARNGWWDNYVAKSPVNESKPKMVSLWLPVPPEFVRGLTNATLPKNAHILLAGAVNAFLGNIIQ
jgi:hypothetical protein